MINLYRLSIDTPLTADRIIKYIEKNSKEVSRRTKLYDYYCGKHNILKRTYEDATKPNNKVVSPFANYITDQITGYFMGEPVSYNCVDDAMLEEVSLILDYNDEGAENSGIAKDQSIFGVAYEQMYIDEDGNIRFQKINPTTCIPIYDDTIEADLLYFIRYYDNEDILTGTTTTYVEVFSRTYHQLYKKDYSSLSLISEEEHAFGLVPISIFKNNEEEIGDFEPVISLIDAYDNITSDGVNELDYFADSYLLLTGMAGTEPEDIAAMKEQRVMLLPTDGKAEWLIKNLNDGFIENQKNRLADSIHKFSACPNLTDENFAANASGVAIKYKLLGLENKTAKKESEYKKGLQRRLELICNILSLTGADYDYRAIEITFNRNIPSNLIEVADVLNKVGHLLSQKTQINMLPIDIDADSEIERIEEEQSFGYNNYDIQQEVVNNELLADKSISQPD